MKKILHLGSGQEPYFEDGADVTHLDISEDASHVEIVCDLNNGIPFPRNSFDIIIAEDVLEHLLDVNKAVEECWRVLKPGGKLLIRTCYAGSLDHFRDPTHLHAFIEESFAYYIPDTFYNRKYGHYSKARFKLLRRETNKALIWFDLEAIK